MHRSAYEWIMNGINIKHAYLNVIYQIRKYEKMTKINLIELNRN